VSKIDIIIDILTPCLIYSKNSKVIDTEYSIIREDDLSKVLKKYGWKFNWRKEFENNKHIYKLVLKGDNQIQGLISIVRKEDTVGVNLIESAPHNFGHNGQYKGVGGHLFAIASKLSFDYGYEGYVSFTAKTKLINHYQNTLNAILISTTT
jgi:hypothetical protein